MLLLLKLLKINVFGIIGFFIVSFFQFFFIKQYSRLNIFPTLNSFLEIKKAFQLLAFNCFWGDFLITFVPEVSPTYSYKIILTFLFKVFFKRFDMLSQCLVPPVTKKVIFKSLNLRRQPLMVLQMQSFQ